MNENKKLFLGKKRNTEDINNFNKKTITLFSHLQWINNIF